MLSNATITINFSEAMNTASTAPAISVSGFLPSDLTLAWNSAATSVTITPAGGLQYAAVTSPAGTSATNYTVTVGTGARDVAGNTMTSAFTSRFSTFKRVTWVMSPSILYQVDTMSEVRTACSSPLKIGGWSATYSGGQYYSYMVFDLTGAGAPSAMYSIESAKLYATQTSDVGGFYALPAHVEVWRLAYDGSMNLSVFPVLADIGTLASAATPTSLSLDTLSSFKTDFVSNGVTGLLFKLAPATTASWTGDQYACFSCGFHLDMIYLMP